MLDSTIKGCSKHYPKEIIDIWHLGRTEEAMGEVINDQKVYVKIDNSNACGFVHFDESEIIGLFINPMFYKQGCGRELFEFSLNQIKNRPIEVYSTLNAIGFYERMGCIRNSPCLVRRHERDIYVEHMRYC